jgi:hypothetical protein
MPFDWRRPHRLSRDDPDGHADRKAEVALGAPGVHGRSLKFWARASIPRSRSKRLPGRQAFR